MVVFRVLCSLLGLIVLAHVAFPAQAKTLAFRWVLMEVGERPFAVIDVRPWVKTAFRVFVAVSALWMLYLAATGPR